MANSLSHSLTVENITIRGIPGVHNIHTPVDEQGLLLGLPRLPGEPIREYKYRLLDVYTNRANSTYRGLINGITRELSLELFKPFRIQPKSIGDTFIAPDPVVVFNGPIIEFWSDWTNSELEFSLDRFEQSGSVYYIGDLMDYVNTNSSYFQINLLNSNYDSLKSMTIVNQTNVRKIQAEDVLATQRFTLRYPGQGGGLINSVYFSEPTNDGKTFITSKNSREEVIKNGDYYIDLYTGDVFCFRAPVPGTTVRYTWIDNQFMPVASPIIIHDINSLEFKKKMFEQILQDDGTTVHGKPTALGADLLNELLTVYPLYYDE